MCECDVAVGGASVIKFWCFFQQLVGISLSAFDTDQLEESTVTMPRSRSKGNVKSFVDM